MLYIIIATAQAAGAGEINGLLHYPFPCSGGLRDLAHLRDPSNAAQRPNATCHTARQQGGEHGREILVASYQQRITENYNELSSSQRKIADFILTSPRDAAFMTASGMADLLGLDVATITRLAQRLGYRGYPQLLADIRASVKEEMGATVRSLDRSGQPGQVFMHTLATEQDNLKRTAASIAVAEAQRAIEALQRARAIFTVGQHTASAFALDLAVRLQMLRFNASVLSTDPVPLAVALRNLTRDDVVVGFGFSGYATDVAAILGLARERSATTIGISASPVSPVARNADIVLLCVAATPTHIPSGVGMAAIVEAITQALLAQREADLTESLHAMEATFRAYSRRRAGTAQAANESIMKLY